MSIQAQAGHFGVVADAPADQRAEFVRKTYLHLGGAILIFTALAALIINSPLAPIMTQYMVGSSVGWLASLVAFMAVGWIAEKWAMNVSSKPLQYFGLGLYVVAEAFLMTPLLYIAASYSDPNVIPTAGLLTLTVFGGLTAVVVFSGKDFSFLGKFLMLGGFLAIGLIVTSLLIGFSLGTLFAAGMVALASGYILYYTSKIMLHYPIGSHVAAALNLFAAVALLFWYILMLVMGGRD